MNEKLKIVQNQKTAGIDTEDEEGDDEKAMPEGTAEHMFND